MCQPLAEFSNRESMCLNLPECCCSCSNRSFIHTTRLLSRRFITAFKGGVSQVVLFPLPEALMVRRGGSGGGGGGRRREKLSVPLAPFDKFMRTTSTNKVSSVFVGLPFFLFTAMTLRRRVALTAYLAARSKREGG